MKSSHLYAAIALLFLAALPHATAACTNSTIAGTYGYTVSGTLFLPQGAAVIPAPVAASGAITFDLNGGLRGSQNRSVGGAFLHEILKGTYTINRDCSLKFTAEVSDDSGTPLRTSVIDGVVVDNGEQIRAMFESTVLPNGASLGSALTAEAVRVHGHGQ
jgi:hypothetical protein